MVLVVACLTAPVCVSTARALLIAPPPGPSRILTSDAVIVGKVVGLESQDVKVDSVAYRIAIVQVGEAIRGAKDAKTVRVGFVPLPSGAVKGPIIRPGFRGVQLQVGQDGLFLLKKHPQEKFFTLGGPAGYFVNREDNPGFAKDVAAVKKITKVIADPKAGLKSKNADDRLISASVLIEDYRTFRGPGNAKTEPIDAEQSKQIMLALASADWNPDNDNGMFQPNPMNLFYRLGITEKDGWAPPPGGNPQAAMQTWLRDNAEKYRIQRFVAGESK